MKVLALITIAVMFLAVGSLAIADDNDPNNGYKDTSTDWWHNHSVYDPDRRNPVGVGLDLVVYESDTIFESAAVETRYDWQNDETSAYLVGRINLFRAVKNVIQ